MQNNVTELTQRLLRALDNNYNVIDMPTVIEIISFLEKITITKEVLETTRLGRHVNELRRNAKNESLAKRAKELVKKWRSMVIPEPNGQIQQDNNKKRPLTQPNNPAHNLKRPKINGQSSEFDFSDSSNSSFKDVASTTSTDLTTEPKKRGRKKGSRNHSALVDEAETSFSNKMAVSRGNAKVKTTQELVASLQGRAAAQAGGTTTGKVVEDLNERAAKLTERVSIIDQKLNTNANRYKASQRKKLPPTAKPDPEPPSSTPITADRPPPTTPTTTTDDDIIVVVDDDDVDSERRSVTSDRLETEPATAPPPPAPASLSVEEALARLPPVDASLLADDTEVRCSCVLREEAHNEEEDDDVRGGCGFVEDEACPARRYLEEKYRLLEVDESKVRALHDGCVEGVNGNWGVGGGGGGGVEEAEQEKSVVPTVGEVAKRGSGFDAENYRKYSISNGDDVTFREWHEVVERRSYGGDPLRILPYCIID